MASLSLPSIVRAALVALASVGFVAVTAAADESSSKSSSAVQAIDDADAVRVMTFNIRYNNPKDGKNAWPHRKEKVASMIRLHRADLAGLQEVQLDQLQELQRLLPEWSWAGVRGRAGTGEGDEHVPILYRTNRFELVDQGVFWLSETPEVQASKGWDAAMTRICVWAKLRDRRTSKEFVLFNTHFDHVGEKARTESAKLIMARGPTIAKDLPVLVIGDMNCLDRSPAYANFTGKQESDAAPAGGFKLQDALHATLRPHHGPTSTFQGFGPLPPEQRIDYIFVTPGVKVLQHAVLTDKWNLDRWPSDHLPVLAEVLVN
jgi:endonuclease/exonuclease/phosphatase family metal-dependent hydrolase